MAFVSFTPNHQPLPACYPSDVNGMLDLLTTGGGLSGQIADTAGGGVFVGSTPPSSSLTNKVWYKTDAAGRPLGVFMFYNGNWRKVYTGVALYEIRMFAGPFSLYFDGTGRGLVGGDVDGWALCNGQNGTLNLEGYFPVSGLPGQSVGQGTDGWFSNCEGTGWHPQGGQRGLTLNMNYLPPMVAHSHIAGYTVGSGGQGAALSTNDGTAPDYQLPVSDGAGNRGLGHQLPSQHLYIALGFIQFVGYQ
jgi:hypothetical protein